MITKGEIILKKNSLLFILTLILTFLASSVVGAKELEPMYDVELDKVWTITLSHEPSQYSLRDNISITNNGQPIPLTVTSNGKKIIVKTNKEYEPDTTYLLTVHEGLENIHGVSLKEPVSLTFVTTSSKTKPNPQTDLNYNGPTFYNEYGLHWKVRDLDYKNLELYSDLNGEVVAEYSTRTNFEKYGVKIGDTKEDALRLLGKELGYIATKDRSQYYRPSRSGESLFYEMNGEYVVYYYDLYDNNKIRSIQWVKKEVEESKGGEYGLPSKELRKGFEDLTVLLINQTRMAEGLDPLLQRNDITPIARAHSEDMVANNFYSHVNLKGESPQDRVRNAGFQDLGTGENIFMGPASAIVAHEGFMNSKGHRDNILRPGYDYVSVGVAFNTATGGTPYYTVKLHIQW